MMTIKLKLFLTERKLKKRTVSYCLLTHNEKNPEKKSKLINACI